MFAKKLMNIHSYTSMCTKTCTFQNKICVAFFSFVKSFTVTWFNKMFNCISVRFLPLPICGDLYFKLLTNVFKLYNTEFIIISSHWCNKRVVYLQTVGHSLHNLGQATFSCNSQYISRSQRVEWSANHTAKLLFAGHSGKVTCDLLGW